MLARTLVAFVLAWLSTGQPPPGPAAQDAVRLSSPAARRGEETDGPSARDAVYPSRPTAQDDAYLSWSEEQAVRIGERFREDGRVGGFLDTRILSTDRSYNYKLRATWLTPLAIRAAARLAQLRELLTDDETRALVAEAEAVGDTVILVEIDPREGSGVIPLDWVAVLRPKAGEGEEVPRVRGESRPALRRVKALGGVAERDYSYDVFWVVFPLRTESGEPLFDEGTQEAELVVRIYEKEGRVSWPVPASIRERLAGAGEG